MRQLSICNHNNPQLRGACLPGRLRISARRGVTLIELLIAMLILAIVCVAWLEIIGIQSARREARRREAVERLAGMMDAFMQCKTSVDTSYGYQMVHENAELRFERESTKNSKKIYPVYSSDISSIGYQLLVWERGSVMPAAIVNDWAYPAAGRATPPGRWLVGRLYEHSGSEDDAGKPFFSLTVCLGL